MICVQIYDDPGRETRVKASQCFTKYKWRELGPAEVDSGPAIVATQVRINFWPLLVKILYEGHLLSSVVDFDTLCVNHAGGFRLPDAL